MNKGDIITVIVLVVFIAWIFHTTDVRLLKIFLGIFAFLMALFGRFNEMMARKKEGR